MPSGQFRLTTVLIPLASASHRRASADAHLARPYLWRKIRFVGVRSIPRRRAIHRPVRARLRRAPRLACPSPMPLEGPPDLCFVQALDLLNCNHRSRNRALEWPIWTARLARERIPLTDARFELRCAVVPRHAPSASPAAQAGHRDGQLRRPVHVGGYLKLRIWPLWQQATSLTLENLDLSRQRLPCRFLRLQSSKRHLAPRLFSSAAETTEHRSLACLRVIEQRTDLRLGAGRDVRLFLAFLLAGPSRAALAPTARRHGSALDLPATVLPTASCALVLRSRFWRFLRLAVVLSMRPASWHAMGDGLSLRFLPPPPLPPGPLFKLAMGYSCMTRPLSSPPPALCWWIPCHDVLSCGKSLSANVRHAIRLLE